MPKELPSDDEILAELRRSRPGMAFEAVGCVSVLACGAAGGLLGALAVEALLGPIPAAWDRQAPVRAYMLILGTGALIGLVTGVLAFQLARRLALRLTRPEGPDRGELARRLALRLARPASAEQPGVPFTDGPYTPEDFPCPDPMPGGKGSRGGLFGDPAPVSGEVAFAVVAPKGSSSAQELRAIGGQLLAWKAANGFVRRIHGLEQLLEGKFPVTRADMFWLAAPTDTEKVALVYVAVSADNEHTGESLTRALEGLSVAMVVSPGYYSQLVQ